MQNYDPLRKWERSLLWSLVPILLLFGGLVTYRSAFSERRMGDVNMLFRAAWAARIGGEQLYTITSDNGLNYHYPPFFAYLLSPFAHPPAGETLDLALPLGVSVFVWYVLNVGLMLLGTHLMASVLESVLPPTLRYGRRWWTLRIVPVVVCVVDIGTTLNQGQVTILLLLMLLVGAIAQLRKRSMTAGVWLGAAICVKIFPAFLALVPFTRRDFRCFAGLFLALFLGLILFPVLVYGPTTTLDLYHQLEDVLIGPALGWGEDRSRHEQLFSPEGPSSQSLVSAITTLMEFGQQTTFHDVPSLVRVIFLPLALAMTVLTLWVFRPSKQFETNRERTIHALLFFGVMLLLMVILCPVSHKHYLMLAFPLVATIFAISLYADESYRFRLGWVLVLYFAGSLLPSLPMLDFLKEWCIPLYAALMLWAVGLWAGSRQSSILVEERPVSESDKLTIGQFA